MELAEVSVLLAVFAATFLVTYIAYLLKKKKESDSGRRYPPCLPTLPIVGSIPFVRGGLDVLPDKFMKLSKKLGPVFTFYAGSRCILVLNGKSVFEALLKKSETFADRPTFWTEVNILNVDRRGIIFSPYTDVWKKNRKLCLSILKEFGFGVTKESDLKIWNEVEKLIEMIRSLDGMPTDLKNELNYSTANVVINILLGSDFQKREHHIRNIINKANEWAECMDPAVDVFPILRFIPFFKKKLQKTKHVQGDLLASLEEAIQQNKSSNSSDTSFARRFLEIKGPETSHQDLLFVLRDMCVASADTLIATLSWLLLEMANNPQVQARIQKELDDVVPENRLPSYTDRLSLPYTEAAILESLRLHTHVPLSVLHKTTKDTELEGYFIPKGWMVIPNLYSVNMDPDTWTDPENYRPERFLDANNKIVGKENVVSFSIGKRSCIGEVLARHEVFVFFASLLQHFEIRPPEGFEKIPFAVHVGITIEPMPYKMRLIPRKKK